MSKYTIKVGDEYWSGGTGGHWTKDPAKASVFNSKDEAANEDEEQGLSAALEDGLDTPLEYAVWVDPIEELRIKAAEAIRAVGIALMAADPGAPKVGDEEYEDWLTRTIGDEIADDSSKSILTMAMGGE